MCRLRLRSRAMAQSYLNIVSPARPASRVRAVLVWGAMAIAVVVLLAALALWHYYGTTVFFEMIASGVSACF
jgi:hypothetical protein